MDPFVKVDVVRHGTQKPARVLVKFVDDEFEGREEWVPPARLKVRWSEVEEYRAREERWGRIHAAGPRQDDPREAAAEEVFDALVDEDIAYLGYRNGGALSIKDLGGLAALLGVLPEEVVVHPDAFEEDGVLVAPWVVTESIAARLARLNPGPVMDLVGAQERKAAREAIHGETLRSTRGQSWYIPPEGCVQLDEEHYKPKRMILRDWCGAEAADRHDELVELRKEIKRVGDVAQQGIDQLRRAGHESQAAHLQRELGTPVELLRGED